MKKLALVLFFLSNLCSASNPPVTWNSSCASGIYDLFTAHCLDVSLAISGFTGTGTVTQLTPVHQAISGTAINWSTGYVFTKTLSASTTFTFTNLKDAQTIIVRLTNTASNYTVTWPTTSPVNVYWSGGTGAGNGQPVETIGAKEDVWTFIYDGTSIYGGVIQNFP